MTDALAAFLAKAADQPVQLTVRDLLAVWGASYRDYDTVGRIQRDLAEAGLHCRPPFTEGSASSVVQVGTQLREAAEPLTEQPAQVEDEELVLPEVSLRMGDIRSAVGGITFVSPDASLEDAQAIMMRDNFSQLAVMMSPSALRGAVSWDTIARAHVRASQVTLADAIDPHPKVVHANEELFGQMTTIYDAGHVFVRDRDDRVCGIVTTADLSDQFQLLTEPFFQLGEIERRLRRCITRAFTVNDLQCVAAARKPITSVDDMMFGQYIRLLSDASRWHALSWQISREIFISELDEVRKIRNRVMHFSAKPLVEEQQELLRSFLSWIRHLDPLP
jgi:CBS domain-containing protein